MVEFTDVHRKTKRIGQHFTDVDHSSMGMSLSNGTTETIRTKTLSLSLVPSRCQSSHLLWASINKSLPPQIQAKWRHQKARFLLHTFDCNSPVPEKTSLREETARSKQKIPELGPPPPPSHSHHKSAVVAVATSSSFLWTLR